MLAAVTILIHVTCILVCQTNDPVYVPNFTNWSANTTPICLCRWFLRDYAMPWLINSPAPWWLSWTASRIVPLSPVPIYSPYCTDSPLDGGISSHLGREKRRALDLNIRKTPLCFEREAWISQSSARKEEEHSRHPPDEPKLGEG